MRSFKNLISIFSFAVALLIFIPQAVSADSGTLSLSGWAWNAVKTNSGDSVPGGAGWISFSSANCANNACGQNTGAVGYGVNENTDGTLTGYAWSSNIGWIQFGGLSGFPSGAGTTASNAQVTGGELVGWARACAGTATGDCSTMANRTDNGTDGWDGWISLSGANYGISVSSGNFSGWAWGGPGLGWISFNPTVSGAVPGTQGCTSATSCGVVAVPAVPGFTPYCGGISLSSGQTNPSSTVVSANATGGFTGSIDSITVSPSHPALPDGTTYTLSPGTSITCNDNGTCGQLQLSIQLSSPVPADGTTYPLLVQGQSSSPAGLSYSCTVNVTATNPSVPPPNGNTQFHEF